MELLESAIKILKETEFPLRAFHLDKVLRPQREDDSSYPAFPRNLQKALESDERVIKFNINGGAYYKLKY